MSYFRDVLLASPIPDGEQWCIKNPDGFGYQSDVAGLIVADGPVPNVHGGFVTDWASIPRQVWSILPPWGRYGPASVPHDKGYWDQTLPRETIDLMLREASLLLGVGSTVVDEIFAAVRLFGQAAWERNEKLRASGYTRLSNDALAIAPYAGIPDHPGATA